MARPLRSERRETQRSKREAQKKDSPRARKTKTGFGAMVPAERLQMKPVLPLSDKQGTLISLIPTKTLTFVTGPAGTGKTACPIGVGLAGLLSGEHEQMILTKADFTIDGKWAPVPGDEHDKYEYLFRPMRQNFTRFISASHLENLEKNGKVKFVVLSTVLGMTYDDAFMIFDEAQCCTENQMKAFLTRMGQRTRCVIAGDHRDQKFMEGRNGMEDALYRFRGNKHVGRVDFDVDDIVRSDFVKDVILAYRNVGEDRTLDHQPE